MKKMIGVFCACAVFLGAMGSANATVPQLMPVQGMLSDSVGAPIDGLTKLTFKIYNTFVDVTPVWTEVYELTNAVDVQDGFFTVYLGSIDPSGNPLVIDWDAAEQWLGIAVAEDVEMPRIRLASVPFASEAQVCRQLGALDEGDADDLAVLIDTGCPADTAFRAFDGTGGLICDPDDTGAGGGITTVNGTAPITASTVGGTVTVGVTTGTTAGTVATGNHTHDHGAITGLADDDHPQYFNLVQNENVNGDTSFGGEAYFNNITEFNSEVYFYQRPSFSYSGAASPFLVTSSAVVTNLNADQLDGQHGSYYSPSTHNHTGTYIPMMTCTTNYVLKYDGDSWECAADNDTNTTYTAGAGLSLTGTAFSVDTSLIQARVSGTCSEGTAIRAVGSTGTVTCQQVAPPAPVELSALNMGTTASVGINWTQLDIGTKTFTKAYGSASTKMELFFNSRLFSGTFAGGATGIQFQLRVDGTMPDVAQDYWIQTSAITERAIFVNYFTSLGAGNHTVTLWARTNLGTSASVAQDPGGWGGAIIVKEY